MSDHESLDPDTSQAEAPDVAQPPAAAAPDISRPPAPQVDPPAYPLPRPRSPHEKVPLLAGFLSLAPGLGNIYNGLYLRGVAFFLVCTSLFALAVNHDDEAELAVLIPSMFFMWFFNIIDAYRQANFINFGYTAESDWAPKPRSAPFGSGGLALGVAIFVIGLYGFLRDRFDFDLRFLVDYWYVIFMAFGVVMVTQWLRQRRPAEDDATDEIEGLG